MSEPAAYPRRILLAVTGLSPQVVTETLYALAIPCASPFVPTEIHLLTTQEGARRARAALLHPDGGQFHALLADYPQMGNPVFDDAHIHVIATPDGMPLPDIRTPDENAAAADAITTLVAKLTRDDAAALHASLAGGRKTMGFYLGYAFSLFARPQDRLSHVLVSSPFENHPQFFYPPIISRRLVTGDGHHVDTAEAVVTLAEIPIVRLRHGLPIALQDGHASFNDTVAAAQKRFAPPRLFINLNARQVRCGDEEIALPPALVAWLAWWAEAALAGRPMQNWRGADAGAYLRLYLLVVGIDAEAYENARRRLAHGMEQAFFQENNAKLERRLKSILGFAAAPYLLAKTGKRPHTHRGLTLPPESIELR